MAAVVQIDGLSGTGKSTLCTELVRRGYDAVDADIQFRYFGDPDTGLPTDRRARRNWLWDVAEVRRFCSQPREAPVFLCGGAMNQDECRDLFTTRIKLCIDEDTMRDRLRTRTSNSYGQHPQELAEQLRLNRQARSAAQPAGWVTVDATKPLSEVVDDVIRRALGR